MTHTTVLDGLPAVVDTPDSLRSGPAGHFYYYRPTEVLVLEADLARVSTLQPMGPPVHLGRGARADQRLAKRFGPAPFGVVAYPLPAGTDARFVVATLRARGLTCDLNYVTAPSPMRSHAVSYAEPADVDLVDRPHPADVHPNVSVGILDTGRPYYSREFQEYYAARFLAARRHAAGDGTLPVSPLVLLDGRFRSAVAPRGNHESPLGHDDRDTMVTSFGRLGDPHAGHGLFVASIVARYAPNADLVAETTMSPDGIGDLHDMLVDIDHALRVGCRVLNMSMGFQTDDGPNGLDPESAGCPVMLKRGLAAIAAADAKLVASAGNDGSDRPAWPAADESVIAVAAVDDAGNPTLWSNYGAWVDVCAAGNDVTSDYVYADWDFPDDTAKRFRGAATWSGTSFAAPLVAAVLARELGEHLRTTPVAAAPPTIDGVWSDVLQRAWRRAGGPIEPAERPAWLYGPQIVPTP